MSFIDIDTSNVPDLKSLPADEYQLRLLSAEQKNSKKGDPMIEIKMDVPAEPTSENIYHYIMLPKQGDDEKVAIRKLQNLKEFKAAFNMPASGPINLEDYEGATGWALLVEEENDQTGKMQNRVKRFIAGK